MIRKYKLFENCRLPKFLISWQIFNLILLILTNNNMDRSVTTDPWNPEGFVINRLPGQQELSLVSQSKERSPKLGSFAIVYKDPHAKDGKTKSKDGQCFLGYRVSHQGLMVFHPEEVLQIIDVIFHFTIFGEP
jgi:hypothetical protein